MWIENKGESNTLNNSFLLDGINSFSIDELTSLIKRFDKNFERKNEKRELLQKKLEIECKNNSQNYFAKFIAEKGRLIDILKKNSGITKISSNQHYIEYSERNTIIQIWLDSEKGGVFVKKSDEKGKTMSNMCLFIEKWEMKISISNNLNKSINSLQELSDKFTTEKVESETSTERINMFSKRITATKNMTNTNKIKKEREILKKYQNLVSIDLDQKEAENLLERLT